MNEGTKGGREGGKILQKASHQTASLPPLLPLPFQTSIKFGKLGKESREVQCTTRQRGTRWYSNSSLRYQIRTADWNLPVDMLCFQIILV